VGQNSPRRPGLSLDRVLEVEGVGHQASTPSHGVDAVATEKKNQTVNRGELSYSGEGRRENSEEI